jgi:hypothetical protein
MVPLPLLAAEAGVEGMAARTAQQALLCCSVAVLQFGSVFQNHYCGFSCRRRRCH